jgi:hypothetical protein
MTVFQPISDYRRPHRRGHHHNRRVAGFNTFDLRSATRYALPPIANLVMHYVFRVLAILYPSFRVSERLSLLKCLPLASI